MLVYVPTLIVAWFFARLGNRPVVDHRHSRRMCSATAGPSAIGALQSTQARRTRVVGAFFAAGALTAVAALRWRVGTDYWTYTRLYEVYVRTPLAEIGLLGEPGIAVIAKIVAAVRGDSVLMLALASVVTVSLIVGTLFRRSPDFPMSIVLYVLTMTWQDSFNGVRQYLACAVLFAGHGYVLSRRPLHYTGVIALASMFHVSAVIGILAYWIPRRRLGLLGVASLCAVAVGSTYLYGQAVTLINGLKGGDVGQSDYFLTQVNPLRLAVAVAPLLLLAVATNTKRLDASGWFYANMIAANAALVAASSGSAYLARFVIYTSCFVPLSLPYLVNQDDRRLRSLTKACIVVGYLIYWYLVTARVPELAAFKWITERP